MSTNNAGRKTVVTPEVIAKLEESFLLGCTDKEAIFLANISKDAFYDYCAKNPEFAERKEELKDMPKIKARMNINKALDEGDKNLSQWYLERKVKEEFAHRSELTGKDGKDLVPVDKELKAKSDEAINEFLNDKGNS